MAELEKATMKMTTDSYIGTLILVVVYNHHLHIINLLVSIVTNFHHSSITQTTIYGKGAGDRFVVFEDMWFCRFTPTFLEAMIFLDITPSCNETQNFKSHFNIFYIVWNLNWTRTRFRFTLFFLIFVVDILDDQFRYPPSLWNIANASAVSILFNLASSSNVRLIRHLTFVHGVWIWDPYRFPLTYISNLPYKPPYSTKEVWARDLTYKCSNIKKESLTTIIQYSSIP